MYVVARGVPHSLWKAVFNENLGKIFLKINNESELLNVTYCVSNTNLDSTFEELSDTLGENISEWLIDKRLSCSLVICGQIEEEIKMYKKMLTETVFDKIFKKSENFKTTVNIFAINGDFCSEDETQVCDFLTNFHESVDKENPEFSTVLLDRHSIIDQVDQLFDLIFLKSSQVELETSLIFFRLKIRL